MPNRFLGESGAASPIYAGEYRHSVQKSEPSFLKQWQHVLTWYSVHFWDIRLLNLTEEAYSGIFLVREDIFPVQGKFSLSGNTKSSHRTRLFYDVEYLIINTRMYDYVKMQGGIYHVL
jgi:hypothetical protein